MENLEDGKKKLFHFSAGTIADEAEQGFLKGQQSIDENGDYVKYPKAIKAKDAERFGIEVEALNLKRLN